MATIEIENNGSLLNRSAVRVKLMQEARDNSPSGVGAYHWNLAGDSLRVSKETLDKLERALLSAIRAHVQGLQRKGKTL
jgi:hypothetical protein